MGTMIDGVYRVDDPGPDATEAGAFKRAAANIPNAQFKLRGISYTHLAELIGDKEPNVRNKLSRRKVSAAYFMECLTAIGTEHLRLG
ncbi:MAG: DUF6471 domain-containing protein [Paracoccaceae bacterium]